METFSSSSTEALCPLLCFLPTVNLPTRGTSGNWNPTILVPPYLPHVALQNVFKAHPCWSLGQGVFPSKTFHCVYGPHFVHSSVEGHSSCFHYCDLRCYERGIRILLSIFPNIRSFPMSQNFLSGGQSIGASGAATIFPMNIQG